MALSPFIIPVTPESTYKLLGFHLMPPPTVKYPDMPEKISIVPNEALGDLISTYAIWREYSEQCTVIALSAVARINDKYKRAYDSAVIMSSGKNRELRDAQASIEVDAERIEVTDAQILYNMLNSKKESIVSNLAVLSREISRRGVK